MLLSSLALCIYVLSFFSLTVADSAWNGVITPGSSEPTTFTPYYVAPGTKGYDSSSPLLHYSGRWRELFSTAYIHNTLRSTSEPGASMSFTFTGTGIEWFGNQDQRHGMSYVYMDGSMVREVDGWSASPLRQQRLYWNYQLPPGRHTFKIVNSGTTKRDSQGSYMDVDALVVTLGGPSAKNDSDQGLDVAALPPSDYPQLFDLASASVSGWTLSQKGSTGVSAMQLAVISPSHAIVIDKVEHNPLTVSGHPAWGALYNLDTHALKPLTLESNSFCAGGTFLSNGTLINVGGNPVVEDYTSAADFGDLDGLQAIRIFEPCDTEDVASCSMYENHGRIRTTSPRWYNTVLRISDGSAMIIGGSLKGGWVNNATVNNPTLEYWPPKDIHGSNGLAIYLPFLADTLNANLFPIAFSLPDGYVFMAANQDAMIYDWRNDVERRLPQIPNGVRVTYPMAGTALLLPLSSSSEYAPEVLICGGSTVDDTKAGYEITSQDPASAQCSRLLLTDTGISAGWQVEQMPQARTMPDAVLLPTGDVVILNGAGTGISGYGNVLNQVGSSNADNPVLTPVLYRPNSPQGQRFLSGGMPSSDIPRMYHSVATLTPNGNIMIAGSNPNLDRSEIEYGTEYRVEWLNPPYMTLPRPKVTGSVPAKLGFGETIHLNAELPSKASDVQVALMDLGFVTHTVHANSRLVYLVSSLSDDQLSLTITGPPDGGVYPPGPGWLYVLADGVPSIGIKVIIGDGIGPAVNEDALTNLLSKTEVDQYEKSKKKGKGKGKSKAAKADT